MGLLNQYWDSPWPKLLTLNGRMDPRWTQTSSSFLNPEARICSSHTYCNPPSSLTDYNASLHSVKLFLARSSLKLWRNCEESADSKNSIQTTLVSVTRKGNIVLWLESDEKLLLCEQSCFAERKTNILYIFTIFFT